MPPKYTAAEKKAYKAKLAKAMLQSGKKTVVVGIKGKGDYIVPTKSLKTINGSPAGEVIGENIGSLLGRGDVGKAIGKGIGGLLHRGLKWFTGWGDYQQHVANAEEVLGNRVDKSLLHAERIPEFASSKKYTTIHHEECIGSVYSTTAFGIQTFRVNPGVSATFPWLSAQAKGYGQYYIEGMVFQVKSFLSDSSSSNGVLGEWGISTQYDVSAPLPVNFNDFTSGEFAVTSRGSQTLLGLVECDPNVSVGTKWKFVSTDGAPLSEQMIRDVCQLQIATQGFTSAGLRVGEIWVTYKAHFARPVPNGGQIPRSSAFNSGTLTGPATAGTADWNAGLTPSNFSTLGGKWIGPRSFSLPKRAGNYMFIHQSSSNSAISNSATLGSVSSDVTAKNSFPQNGNGNNNAFITFLSGQTTICAYSFSYTAATPGDVADIVLNTPGIAANAVYMNSAFLFSRESGLVALEHLMCSMMVPRDLANYITNYVVSTQYDDNGNVVSMVQYPYSGPVPPTEEYEVTSGVMTPAVNAASSNSRNLMSPTALSGALARLRG